MVAKKITIITVNYNNREGLQKTIYSVLDQKFQDFEFIIVDGGSTDGSKQIIENCDRVDYWISEKDSGIYNAMNKGIKAATGDYIIFMNSGDCFYSINVLDTIKNEFDNNIDILFGNAFFVTTNKRFEVEYPDKLNFSFFYTNSLCHQSTFYKREIFDGNLYNEDLKIVSDWEFNIRNICLKNKSYKHINVIICDYYLDGVSHHQKESDHNERKIVLEKHFGAFIDDYEKTIEKLAEHNKPLIKDLKKSASITNKGYVSEKRLNQLLFISQNNRFSYKIIKAFITISLFFNSKKKFS
ncbi:glycosyltransferase family 2 protein [Flavobacterium sp. DGU38]|uniref:Glycosyltransferase family 2 protein n=1 Tax=Flavobacterium calami TaxID=3139144 RepID=A0ABU9ISU2_9FLAO